MTQGLELRGAVLGKGYRLGRPIDDSDETVFEATHERIPGRFVVRLFPVETLSQPESSFRIQRGARVASLLRDPHAVQVLDCNASGEIPAFVVLERQPGQSLATVMAENGMLPLARVVELVESIAAALAAGHQIGLVHGDLRPAHVTLPTSGQPPTKLSGFGWAKELRAAARIPTPSGYLAPEQQFGKNVTLDERADQFALAALAYEMIAACLPFSEESADMAELLGARRTPPAIADLVPGVPAALDEVLRRALSFTPSDRFSNVVELASRLRAAAAIQSKSAPPVPATASSVAGGATGAAAPTKARSDVTDELDLATLAPIQADDADGGDGRVPSDKDDDRDDKDEKDDDAKDDDAKLVLGATSGGTATDDAKTQIRRSPFFFLDEPSGDDGQETEEAHAEKAPAPPPRRGVPVGRPGMPLAPVRHRESAELPMMLAPSHPTGPASTFRNLLTDKLSLFWTEVRKRQVWTFPAATGACLLLIVGTMLWMSQEPDDDSPQVAEGTPAGQLPPRNPGAAPVTAAPTAAPNDRGSTHMDSAPSPNPSVETRVDPLRPSGPSSLASAAARSVTPARSQATRPTARRLSANPVPDPDPNTATERPALGGGPDDCSIRISSRPWAEVWIDGKNTGRKTPIDNLKVACGMRKLELKRPDKDIEQMEMLKVVPGKPYRGDYELE